MPLTYQDIERLGANIARSGLFGIKTPEQAVALMMIAQAEGRHPALAARDYDVIQGRPSKKSEAMLRDFLEAGGKVEWHKLDDAIADATFHHPQGGKVRISWDMERANKAGLGGKDNWKKFPRQMLRSRCISEGVRTVWPMATSGLYEPGEVADFTTTIDHEPEPEKPARPQWRSAEGEDADRLEAAEAKAAKTAREQINRDVPLADTPSEPQPQKMSWSQWADSLEISVREATNAELGRLLARAEVTEIYRLAKEGKPSPAKQRIIDAMAEAEERYLADPPEPEEDAPAIKGEEKVFAG